MKVGCSILDSSVMGGLGRRSSFKGESGALAKRSSDFGFPLRSRDLLQVLCEPLCGALGRPCSHFADDGGALRGTGRPDKKLPTAVSLTRVAKEGGFYVPLSTLHQPGFSEDFVGCG